MLHIRKKLGKNAQNFNVQAFHTSRFELDLILDYWLDKTNYFIYTKLKNNQLHCLLKCLILETKPAFIHSFAKSFSFRC